MNEIEDAIEELKKLSRYAEILKNPDEFFNHMQGHRTELSLVLSAFGIANMSKIIVEALEKQISKKPIDTLEAWLCPNCRTHIRHEQQLMHCRQCGQLITWRK